ncbi:DUF1097 domain-containing protein [Pseudomonas sp. YuFO8]|jgi:hypothetical protein|uniref:DUF1097 domain-containing protein n=1 Tax=Pseudomonas sp. YuFO8 TaxID=3095361 RepID=UPI002B252DD8|nr:DUF1097 domain-containing protein [Pseudomonas sp. YuFO8]MEB2621132.1 DUF1097 domain-containing protein [Pseudomonas sp. YuFO8]
MTTSQKALAEPTYRLKSQFKFNAMTGVAAATASAAAATSLSVGLPVWAMFIGWVAFFSRGHSGRDGLINYASVLAGLVIGMVAATAIAWLSPSIGKSALPLVVFVVAMMVVSLRAVPVMNNVLAYFLGLIAFFAAHLEPSLDAVLRLGGASAIGSAAAWASLKVQQRIAA